MLRVPRTERRINVSILKELNIHDRLSTRCRRNILKYFGHVIGYDETSLEKLVVQGKIEGKYPRGRSPTRWIDQIKSITEKPLQAFLREPRTYQDGGEW